jgi:carbon-monoxide dehydrogenase large subunit
MSVDRFIGRSIARREDPRLLRGEGRYVADIRLPRMLHVAFVRSAAPHGVIRSIDVSRALAAPGVVAVLTGADIRPDLRPVPGMQNKPPKAWRDSVEHRIDIPDQPILALRKVRYVGEPVAVVVAENRYLAEDAAELVDVDIDPLAPVAAIDAALADDTAVIHEGMSGNVVAQFTVKKGDAATAIANAPRAIRHRFHNHRYLAMPMECRGVVAEYDAGSDAITIWSASQVVHWVRREVASRLSLPETRVRCIAPDVGGGFGVKGHVYPEDVLIPYLARRLGRPVRWIEDRLEHMLNSTHARDDRHDVEVAFDEQGMLLALRDHFVKDSGAYTPVGIGAPSNTIAHMLGPYQVPHFEARATLVVTNKTPNAPYRGSGRPEGVFVMERVMELVAAELGLDPVEVRLRNMVRPDQMPYSVGIPYRDGAPVVYDSGDYPTSLRMAIEALGGLAQIRQRQQQAWTDGRYLGLGVGMFVEGTGAGPFEGATVRIDPCGSIYVATGACDQGQGHKTVFAQVAADEWGVTPDQVTVTISDTAGIAMGYGTIASRSTVNSGSAIRQASTELRRKVFAIAAHLLECHAQDLELRDGHVMVRGVPGMALTLAEIAAAARPGWDHGRPPGISAGLEVTEYYTPPTVTWSYAAHAALVELDRGTGAPRIEKYVVAHDAGVIVNPELAKGQVLGGVAQGIGGGLLEQVVYDDSGQLLIGSLMDYLMPTASDMPPIEVLHLETPSPLNELGVKGLGEGGCIAPPVVLVNAVCDALRPARYQTFATPLRPSELLAAMDAATPVSRTNWRAS